jgi:hypothetical protein
MIFHVTEKYVHSQNKQNSKFNCCKSIGWHILVFSKKDIQGSPLLIIELSKFYERWVLFRP